MMKTGEDDSNLTGLLSVIIPIGAMKGKLTNFYKTIDSTENTRVEFIVVIDDKNDGTAEEVRNFLTVRRQSASTVILQQAFNGPGPARNAGLQEAKNPWIIFCDSDDILWVDNVYEELRAIQPQDNFVIGNFSVKSNSYEKISRSANLMEVALNPGIWRIAIRRSKALMSVFPSLLLAEDQVYLVRSGLFNSKPRFSNRTFYTYHVSVNGQLSSRTLNRDHLSDAILQIDKYSKSIGTFSRENFYLGIVLARLTTTYIKMSHKRRKNLPNEIYRMNLPKAVGFLVGIFLIINSASRSKRQK